MTYAHYEAARFMAACIAAGATLGALLALLLGTGARDG